MKLLSVLTPSSIYRGCSNWKTLWEKKFTPDMLTPVNIKKCGCHDIRKHRDIKYSDNYITLDISLKFGSLKNMIITSSYPKDYLVGSGEGLITSMVIKTNVRSKKNKRAFHYEGSFKDYQLV